VKLDMSFSRGVLKEPTRKKLIQALVWLCKELNTLLIAEGVETSDERDTLVDLGCALFQGFLFAKPSANFADVEWMNPDVMSRRPEQLVLDVAPEVRTEAPAVLIVDDDSVTTEHFAAILRLEGYAAQTADSALKGLEHARAARFSAIVLDLNMPRMDGIGFLRRLRELRAHRDTPVVVVTGDYMMDDASRDELKHAGV